MAGSVFASGPGGGFGGLGAGAPSGRSRPLGIAPSGSARIPSRGSFGEVLHEDTLEIPRDMFDLLSRSGVRNAPSALSFVVTNPSAVMHVTGWGPDDVARATQRLKETLRGHVPESLLEDELPPPRAYGAFPPRR